MRYLAFNTICGFIRGLQIHCTDIWLLLMQHQIGRLFDLHCLRQPLRMKIRVHSVNKNVIPFVDITIYPNNKL